MKNIFAKVPQGVLICFMIASMVGTLPGTVNASSAAHVLDISVDSSPSQTRVTETSPIASQPVSSPAIGTWEVTGTIQLSGTERPLQIAISGGKAYVSRNPGHLTVVDLSTNTVVTTISFDPYPGATPHYIGISGGKAYVALGNLGSDGQLAVINIADNTVSGYIPVGADPHGVATFGQRVYVTNNVWWSSGDPATVKVVDANTNSVVATIPVGINPTSVAVDPVTKKAYVTNHNDLSKSVSVINTVSNSVTTTIPINNPPAAVAISGSRAYVATTVNLPNGTVEVIDVGADNVVSSIPVGRDSWGIAASESYVFVANQASDTVSVIDIATNTVLTTVNVGDDPTGLAVDPTTNKVYVTNQGDNTVSILMLRELPQPPTAYIDSISPNPATHGKDTISFAGHGTDPDGSIVAYDWRSSRDVQLSTSSSFSRPASELSIGTHTIYFKVQDNDGNWSAEVTHTLTILSPQGCTVTIVDGPEANPATVDSNGSTQLSVSATDSQDHSISYSWTATGGSFDNTNSQNPMWRAPRNTSSSTKYYTLTVTARCSKGKTASGSVQVSVRPEEVHEAPTVSTYDASNLGSTSATLNGYLDSTGGVDCLVWFEFGKTTRYESSTTKVSKSPTGSFSASISGLTPGITYHFRACASNSKGTSHGSDVTFTPPLEEVRVRIDSHGASPREVQVRETCTLRFSFTNSGNVPWTFYVAVSLRRPDTQVIHLPIKAVTLDPWEQGSVQWTCTTDMEGSWDVVFGAWEEESQENSLGHTGWLADYIKVVEPELFTIPTLNCPLAGKIENRQILLAFGDIWTWTYCGGLPKKHTGMDLKASVGEDIYAAYGGKIVKIYNLSSAHNWGKGIIIEHSGFTTTYMHVNPVLEEGHHVNKGQRISTIANIDGDDHLHFAVRSGTYSDISKRGALPQEHGDSDYHDGKFTGCKSDPLFPEKFVDPMRLTYETIPSVGELIEQEAIGGIPVTVDGNLYIILTLKSRIDPVTLKVVPDSGDTKIYVYGDRNYPVSDPDIAQKIGLIDDAQRWQKGAGSPESISERITHLWDGWHTYEQIKVWQFPRELLAKAPAIFIRAYVSGGALTLDDLADFAADAVTLYVELFTDPVRLVELAIEQDLWDAETNYFAARKIALRGEITDYKTAYTYLSHLLEAAKCYEEPANYLVAEIGDIDKGMGKEFMDYFIDVANEISEGYYGNVQEARGRLMGIIQIAQYMRMKNTGATIVKEYLSKLLGAAPYTLKLAQSPRIAVEVHSPVELRVYDSQQRVTGVVNGEERNEIPYSMYHDSSVTIFSPTDYYSYSYDVVGTEEGSYDLTVTKVEEQKASTFTLTSVPTSTKAVHQYTIDWDTLSKGEKGVTMRIDSDGDGSFEHVMNLAGIEEEKEGLPIWAWISIGVAIGLAVSYVVWRRVGKRQGT